MKECKSIKIDGAFPDYGTSKLQDAICEGYIIQDKILVGNRYCTYILIKNPELEDVGKASVTNP